MLNQSSTKTLTSTLTHTLIMSRYLALAGLTKCLVCPLSSTHSQCRVDGPSKQVHGCMLWSVSSRPRGKWRKGAGSATKSGGSLRLSYTSHQEGCLSFHGSCGLLQDVYSPFQSFPFDRSYREGKSFKGAVVAILPKEYSKAERCILKSAGSEKPWFYFTLHASGKCQRQRYWRSLGSMVWGWWASNFLHQ